MSTIRTRTSTRTIYTIANLLYSAGSFIADFNHTHVLNPRWSPHAKFHNGQTMSLSILLTVLSLYLVFRPASTVQEKNQDMWIATLTSSFYTAAGLSAILYPGTDWVDPEFEVPMRAGQAYMFGVQVVVIFFAYFREINFLKKSKTS